MPSKRRSNKQAKKPKHLTSSSSSNNNNNNNNNTQKLNHHSSPALQFPGKGELKVLRDQNGRCGNDDDSLRPNNSEKRKKKKKCVCLVVEEGEKRENEVRDFSVSVSLERKRMEGAVVDERLDLEETQKVVVVEEEEAKSEDKGVIAVAVEEDVVKSVVESGGEVAAGADDDDGETLGGEELNVVVEKVEETKEASEPILLSTPNDDSFDAEWKLKENQEKDLAIPEVVDDERVEVEELNNEISSGLANIVRSRETEEAVERTEAEENLLASSEEKDELSSVVTYGVAPKAIEETTIVKPDESEESKLLVEESSLVVQEPSKDEEANVQTLTNVAATETSGSTVQDKTEIPRSSENQTTPVAQRQYTPWNSCCGLFEILMGR